MKEKLRKTTVRMPEYIATILDSYTEKRGISVNQFFIDVACKEISQDSDNKLSELDQAIVKERHANAEITKLKRLRSKNLSEAWEVPHVIQEMKKLFNHGDYIDEERARENLNLSLEIMLKGRQPKKDLRQLLPAMVSFKNNYGWEYGVQKVQTTMKKIGLSDAEILKAASQKDSIKAKRQRHEKKERWN